MDNNPGGKKIRIYTDPRTGKWYYRGLYNLVELYIPHCDKWMIVDNMDLVPEIIAQNDGFGLLYSDSAMALDNINISTFPPNASFSHRVLYGVQKALRKLAEETAMKDGSLVVKIDGEIKAVPAKELLKTLPEQDVTE